VLQHGFQRTHAWVQRQLSGLQHPTVVERLAAQGVENQPSTTLFSRPIMYRSIHPTLCIAQPRTSSFALVKTSIVAARALSPMEFERKAGFA
jgi:hypothetical protein